MTMAKGQKRSTREPRKPKKAKASAAVGPSTFLGAAERASKLPAGGKRPGE